MYWFDISVGLVMLLGGIRSYFRGLTREVMVTLGLLAVFILAVWGHAHVVRYLEPLIASLQWRQFAAYIALMIAAVCVYFVWASLVERMLHFSRLSIPDRVLGGLFGMAKVGVVIAALLTLLAQAAPARMTATISGSKLAPPLLQTAQVITTLLPANVKQGFQRAYNRLRQQTGRHIVQPPGTAPSKFYSNSQTLKPPADISEHDDRALRQLIKKYSQEP